jgi:hypothetical protein
LAYLLFSKLSYLPRIKIFSISPTNVRSRSQHKNHPEFGFRFSRDAETGGAIERKTWGDAEEVDRQQ